MHKVIDDWKIGVKDLLVLTLDERIPNKFNGKVRIAGKEYKVYLMNFCGGKAEDMLDAALRNIAIQTSQVGFIGKEVEFI